MPPILTRGTNACSQPRAYARRRIQ